MSLKEYMKKFTIIRKIYYWLNNCKYAIATVISPKLNTILRYKAVFGEMPNFNNPVTFNEKLLWLKLNNYIKNPLVVQCCDKVGVREYIKEQGCEYLLNEVIDIYERPEDIQWDKLPEKFVLKWNFGAGMNIICKNKSELNKKDVIKQLEKWEKNRYWLSHSEMQYKYIEKKIICEKFLEDKKANDLPDYKVYCFHGEPQAILVMRNRGKNVKTEFFDIDWDLLENSSKYGSPSKQTPKPKCLDEMLDVARKLTVPFPFVRCDFYIVNEKLYFGELTFTPAGGLYTSETKIRGKSMTEYLNLNID